MQGHGWTETWAACRSAPALSSEWVERERESERERERWLHICRTRMGERRGVMGGGGRKETRRKGIYGGRVSTPVFSNSNRRGSRA